MYRSILMVWVCIAQLSASNLSLSENNHTSLSIEEIVTTFSDYKTLREKEVEEKILKPRILNFANYLYQGVLEMKFKDANQSIAYTATLALMAKKGKNVELPDSYQHLQTIILQEAKLILSAKETHISPIFNVMIDYTQFKVAKKYEHIPYYYRTVQFAKIIPLDSNNSTLFTQIKATIKASQRLTNLQNAIYSNLDYLVGIDYEDTDNKRLLLSSTKEGNQTAKELDSSYAYDIEIIKILDNNTSKTYEQSSQNRLGLYLPFNYTMKDIEAKKEISKKELLNTMIENTLSFALTITNNRKDREMVKWLKGVRYN